MAKVTKLEGNNTHKTTKKLRVAAYCRVSSNSEAQEESLKAQKEHYEAYIFSRKDWEFAGLYYDKGITGTKKEGRVQLLQLLEDCEAGKIDFIITKSISRFSRNTTDCLELVRRLLELSIPVYFEKENINTGTMESELFLAILSSLAQDESTSISENNLWAVKNRFKNGTYKIGYPPYGYDWTGEAIVINPAQAPVVRRIFAEALSGKGTHSIAKVLNAEQIPNKKNGLWRATSILAMLKNNFYTGTVTFQKTYKNALGKRQLNYGQKDKYVAEEHHEAIISKETFTAVAKVLENNLKLKNVNKNPELHTRRYAFSGKLYCASCGKKLKRVIHASTTHPYIAWSCPTHIEDTKACSLLYLRDDVLKQAFVTLINKLIYGREVLLKPLLEELKTDPTLKVQKAIAAYQVKLLQNTEQRDTLTKLMTDGFIGQQLFIKEQNELLLKANTYRKEIELLSNSKTTENTRLQGVKALLSFTETNSMQESFSDETFTTFVEKVTILSRTEAIFHLKCGLNLKERLKTV